MHSVNTESAHFINNLYQWQISIYGNHSLSEKYFYFFKNLVCIPRWVIKAIFQHFIRDVEKVLCKKNVKSFSNCYMFENIHLRDVWNSFSALYFRLTWLICWVENSIEKINTDTKSITIFVSSHHDTKELNERFKTGYPKAYRAMLLRETKNRTFLTFFKRQSEHDIIQKIKTFHIVPTFTACPMRMLNIP